MGVSINMIKELDFEQMTLAIFGEEKIAEMKKIAARKAEKAQAEWKKEMEQIMHKIDRKNDIMYFEEEMPMMKHKVLLDIKEFKIKPSNLQAGSIQKRLPECSTEVTIEELAEAVAKGRTFKAAYLTGTTQDTFISSSLIAVDIDNKGEELEQYGYVSVEDFIAQAEKSDIKPALVYTTFSHTEAVHKYRAVFQLEKPVTDLNHLNAVAETIKNEYPYSDAKVSVVHCIYGGRRVVALNKTATVSTNVEYEEKEIKKTSRTKIKGKIEDKLTVTELIIMDRLKALNFDVDVEYALAYDFVNKNISPAYLLGVEKEMRFRCILPAHDDKNASAYIAEYNGQDYYKCSGCQSYLSTIDSMAKILNMSHAKVLHFIANASGIRLGSEYQRNMRALIAEIMAQTDNLIKEGSILYKYMSRSNLHGTYNLIQQFALAHVTPVPLADEEQITFFLSQSQLRDKMEQYNMRGSSMVGYKLNSLKELGIIRALRNEELSPETLAKANSVRASQAIKTNAKYLNRVEYYELVDLSEEVINNAEAIIITLKESGVKRKKINATRRAAALGEDFVANINVQMDVSAKINNPKTKTQLDKLIITAGALIDKQGYFTEEQLRKAFDPKRKIKKDVVQKLIDDSIPHIIKQINIKKDRVKKSTREQHSITSKIKNNTTIYC
jgi:hypothetical protein